MRDLVVPLGIVCVLGSILFPLPPLLLDLLLVVNLAAALTLLVTALYAADPLRLSCLPTVLLLTTLFRLALNISTTRLILASGEAGRVIEAFGAIVMQGNLFVGATVFLIITLVQFVVVAKGSERVAEVAARFTLDALPGKQMSIDADVRAGLIDFETARKKRLDLQAESRFYGALDGAMKFVKGDAIAGIAIVVVNIIGGLSVGIMHEGLAIQQALTKYTMLTVGDGLVSQLPALLNSIAAGLVVTAVPRGDDNSLLRQIAGQLGASKQSRVLVGCLLLAIGILPGMPSVPFITTALLIGVSAFLRSKATETLQEPPIFRPRLKPILCIQLSREAGSLLRGLSDLRQRMEQLRERLYQQCGILVMEPEWEIKEAQAVDIAILLRGVPAGQKKLSEDERSNPEQMFGGVASCIESLVARLPQEFIDDLLTRRLLDCYEHQASELVSAVVPGVITVTQLTTLLKSLASDGIPLIHFDVILQAISEHAQKAGGERGLLAEIRVALRRLISRQYLGQDYKLHAITCDPLFDLMLLKAEKESRLPDVDALEAVVQQLRIQTVEKTVVLMAKGARQLFSECLRARGLTIPVLAYEEVDPDVEMLSAGHIDLPEEGMFDEREQIAA